MSVLRLYCGGLRAVSRTVQKTLGRSSAAVFVNSFSTTDKNSEVPDEFFDEIVEAEKEFCDISMSLIHKRGLEGINSIKENYSWNDLSKFTNRNLCDPTTPSHAPKDADDSDFKAFLDSVKVYKSSIQNNKGVNRAESIQQFKENLAAQLKSGNSFSDEDLENAHVYEESDSEYEVDNRNIRHIVKESKRKPFVPGVSSAERVDESAQSALLGSLGFELPERLAHLEQKMFYRPHDLNPSSPDYGFDVDDDPLTEDFVKDTDPSKYDDDQQGLRHCPGKLQRRGKRLDAPLGCHLIDLDTISAIDILSLKRFLSIDAEILSRKHTGLCSKCQRRVARTIKQSRSMGLLPHIGMLSLADAVPMKPNKPYHHVVKGGGKKNKPIMSKLVPLN